MRGLVLIFLLILSQVGAPAAEVRVVDAGGDPKAAPWKKTPVRVAFWNVEWFPGGRPTGVSDEDRRAQIRAATAEVRRASPDILMACEIRDLAALRQLAPGRVFHFCSAIPRPPDENPALPNQGLAMASRLMPVRTWVLDFSVLPQTPDRPVRGILGAEFHLASGRLVVYGVHLKSNRGNPDGNRRRRQRAVELLREDWNRLGLDPARDRMVVGGDFNTSPEDPQFSGEKTLVQLREAGFVHAGLGRPPGTGFTVAGDGRFPPNHFDHIFVSAAQAARITGPLPWLQVRSFVPAASDHAMLVLDLPN